MFEINKEQITSAVAWLVATVASGLTGWAIARGWDIGDTITAVFNSQSVIGTLVALGVLVVRWLAKTTPKLITMVDSMPNVAGVVTKSTTEGKALAASVPSPTVLPAGSTAAEALVKTS